MSKMGMSAVNGLPFFTDHEGNVRVLARLQPDEKHRKMRAARQSFTSYLQSIGKDLIPENQWIEINNQIVFTKEFRRNQFQCSGCTGYSAAGAEMCLYYSRGHGLLDLSGSSVYGMINGGSDSGSVIVDAMDTLEQNGIALRSEFDYPKIYSSQMSQAVKDSMAKRKLRFGLTISSWLEVGTAIMMGFFPQFPIEVGGNFESFDSDGVAGFTRSQFGNHSVFAAGIHITSSGKRVIWMPNSWGTTWGPFQDGSCMLSQNHIDGCAEQDDGYCHIDIVDNQAFDNAPVPVGS